MGYRMAEPRLDEEAQRQVLAWAEGEPEPLYSQGYPIYTAITSDAGGHPVRHPHRRPRGGGAGGPALRPVGQRRSNGLPSGPARTRGPAP